jgi:heme/copper-type cytochrome/quinol oxidase subunit 2
MHKSKGFGIAGIIIIIAVIAVVGFVGWRVYEAMRPANSNTHSQSNSPSQLAQSTKTFKSDKYGYVLEYPAGWALTSMMQESTEVITLKAPGTTTTEQPIGGYTTDKGAIVILDVSKCPDSQTCSTPQVYKGSYSSSATNRSKFTFTNSVVADRYTFAYESEQALYTVFSEKGSQIVTYFTSEGDELTSPYLNDYNNILNSIKY